MKSYCVTIQMKPLLSAVLSHGAIWFVYQVVLGCNPVRLWRYHGNETSSAVLSHGSICFVCSSDFWACGSGGSRGGALGARALPLFFDQNDARRAEKTICGDWPPLICVCIELVSLIWFLQIWVVIYVYGIMINWSTLIKKLMQTYIVKVSVSILNLSTVHLNGIWHLMWCYLSKPVLGGHPVLSGHYSISRGCPLNTGFTVKWSNFLE